jgi:hypothetical protein
MNANETAFQIVQTFRDSVMSPGPTLDLQDLIYKALVKVGKEEYKRGYQKAKEKWKNANSSNP